MNTEWFMYDLMVHFPLLCSVTRKPLNPYKYMSLFTDDCRNWIL